MLNLFSRLNAALILPIFLWLMVSPCEAVQYPRFRRSLGAPKLQVFSGNITSFFHINESFFGDFNQNAPPNTVSNIQNPVDGNIETDFKILKLVGVSELSHDFQKQCCKSWNNFVFGFCYRYRNFLPLSAWTRIMPLIPCIYLVWLFQGLEHLSPIISAYVIRVCGTFMANASDVVCGVMVLAGFPIIWLLFARFRWQQNKVYDVAVFTPILEEITFRLMLHCLWQHQIQNVRDMNRQIGSILQGKAKNHWSSFVSLVEHKDSFRVLSSLLFGIAHISNFSHIWKSNEIHLQKEFVWKGIFKAVATFFSSFFAWSHSSKREG